MKASRRTDGILVSSCFPRLCNVRCDVRLARSVTVAADDALFRRSAKGQAVLQRVKDFMRQHVFPAQKVSR